MNDINLTQAQADALIAMEKVATNSQPSNFPPRGENLDIEFHDNINGREKFILNYTRSSISLLKCNHHFRRNIIGLIRLDLNGPPHRNPDGEEIGPCHLHIYRENFGMKYAIGVPKTAFPNLNDLYKTLHDFMHFCNVTHIPTINNRLL